MTSQINSVAVIGLGTMGAGIVEVFAKAGHPVFAVDSTPELVQRGEGLVTSSLDRMVGKGKLDQADRDAALGRISWTASMADLSDVDLVVEAVPERPEIKAAVFGELDGVVRPDAILASNTSSLSLTEIAAATERPQRVVGMHFFNPAPVLALVEIIRTVMVDDEVVEAVRDLAVQLGKKPVVVGDRAGFVANALLIPYLARAIRLYETGKVGREDLDNAAKVGIGLPMGPLVLSDLVGLDVVKEVCDVMYDATKRPSDAPPALLRQLVAAGRLGRKTGRGFYDYGTQPGEESTAQTTPFAAAAVVGTGEVAAAFAEALRSAGTEVTVIDDPRTSAVPTDVPLVLLTGGAEADCDDCNSGGCLLPDDDAEPDECSCCGGTAPGSWFPELAESIAAGTVVLAADEASELAVQDGLSDGVTVLQVRLHEQTKGGQVAEVGVTVDADADQVARVRATLSAAGFVPVVGPARPGLVVDALLFPHLNDAVAMVDAGYATAQDVDTAMSAGCGYPTGLFAILERLGAETVVDGLAGQAAVDTMAAPNPLLIEHAVADRAFLS